MMMEKDRMYYISNNIQAIVWFTALLLGLIGIMWITFLVRISAYAFIILGIFLFVRYAYFKRTQVLWANTGTGLSALIWTILEGSVVIGLGIYILRMML